MAKVIIMIFLIQFNIQLSLLLLFIIIYIRHWNAGPVQITWSFYATFIYDDTLLSAVFFFSRLARCVLVDISWYHCARFNHNQLSFQNLFIHIQFVFPSLHQCIFYKFNRNIRIKLSFYRYSKHIHI